MAPLVAAAPWRAELWRLNFLGFLLGVVMIVFAAGAVVTVIMLFLPWLAAVFGAGFVVAILWYIGRSVAGLLRWLKDVRLLRNVQPDDYSDANSFKTLFYRLRTRRAAVNLLERLLRTGLGGNPALWPATVREIIRADPALDGLSRLVKGEAPDHSDPVPPPPGADAPRPSWWRRLLAEEAEDPRHLFAQRDLFFLVLERATMATRG